MSVAAAGLAHETRNPLNIIRGQAQLISSLPEAHPRVKEKMTAITEEVDRVTGRLNQFIDYSCPTEVQWAATDILAVATDVARTLESDLEDKQVAFRVKGPSLMVRADASLLRQVLFNLIHNAIQAVPIMGRIQFALKEDGRGGAVFEVQDDGPGVAPDAVTEIFRPYFTASEGGTGLGLTVVRQIVLAHQWEIVYIPGKERGARFRVTGLRLV
jgi:two-component system sensor histidine kinase HydH